MKASNKKRLEELERVRSNTASSVVIIYNPASPLPEHSNSDGVGVRIFIPDNGRRRNLSPSSENVN
ncbi:MAG TPA: hypothetical protein VGO47_04770 [Chlamydiales bacterium]|nr:hypothetical protein [Chlamydiales bacterium]